LRALKNISRQIGVWHWPASTEASTEDASRAAPEALPLPDNPSIAMPPFENMSSDPEQEFFADGVTEDITTVLSKFRWLFVVGRNSAFSFKDKKTDLREIGRALGVRYVLEGSIRRAGDRVRISAQLSEASDGTQIWADKFDGVLTDIFDLQDQVSLDVVTAIEPSLRHAELERVGTKPTEDMQAYELYFRGQSLFYRMTDTDNQEAIRLLSLAIQRDPGYAVAGSLFGGCQVSNVLSRTGHTSFRQSGRIAETGATSFGQRSCRRHGTGLCRLRCHDVCR
jgi:adenylate cyclase